MMGYGIGYSVRRIYTYLFKYQVLNTFVLKHTPRIVKIYYYYHIRVVS